MKKLLVLLAIFTTFASMAQSVGINADGSTADPSAMLDVSSTTKGFLPPRMTTTQRDVLTPTAAVGLVIFNTTTSSLEYNSTTGWVSCKNNPDGTATGQMQYWNGSNWVNITTGSNGQVLKYASNVPTWSTLTSVPDAPTIGTATRGLYQATVAFTPPVNNGGSAITNYTVFTNPEGLNKSGTSSPIIVTGLTSSTAYNYRVTATNASGTSFYSGYSNTPYTPADAPTNVVATKGEDQKSTISFTYPSGNGSTISGYTITSSPATTTYTTTTSPFVFTGLTNGQTYTFTVCANNSYGAGPATNSNEIKPYTLQSQCGGSTVTFTYNGGEVTYGLIVSGNYKCWLDRNLGASRVATSMTDTSAYGDLFQWGRGADGHQSRTSAYTTTLSSSDTPVNGNFIRSETSANYDDWRSPQNNNLWQGVNGVNNPCPSGYRLPTISEIYTEIASWTNGPFGTLKLPLTGYKNYYSAQLGEVNTFGTFWTSSISGNYAMVFSIRSTYGSYLDFRRGYGCSVRCIKD